MKKILLRAAFMAGISIIGENYLCAQKINVPRKKEVLAVLELTNKYFMDKWPDPGKEIFVPSRNRTWPSHIWTRAVYYEGLMALHAIDKKKAYYDYAVAWSEKHNWGLRDGIKTRNGDNQACGQTYIDLYLADKKEEKIRDIKASIDSMIASPKIDDWWWIDAFQMAMPVFTRLGTIFKEPVYFNRMYEMYGYTKYKHGDRGLYNQEDHLWWRDKDFVAPYKEPNGKNCYWSRGNGWVIAALVRTLQNLPVNDPHYQEYLKDYKDMLAALIPLQRSDGYWNVSLHDSTNYSGKELTGTALFVYGMAWGINNKLIDKKTFLPVVSKAWNAMTKECVRPDGSLGYVQGTGKEPKDSQPVSYATVPDFEDFGLGCFLLAGSEVFRLSR